MSRSAVWMVLLAALLLLVALDFAVRWPRPGSFLTHGGTWLGLCLQVLVVFQAGRFFAESRRTGAMEMLLSTPLSPRELVDGQIQALRGLFGWPALIVMLLFFCSFRLMSPRHRIMAGLPGAADPK